MTRRFEIVPILESTSAERISSVKVENEKNVPSNMFTSYFTRNPFETLRRATISATMGLKNSSVSSSTKPTSSSLIELNEFDSTSVPQHLSSLTDTGIDADELDAYSTVQSTTYDTNPIRPTNKFLQELRSKRREFQEKARNISIDQRIASHRRQSTRRILRAQDIFSVYFELDDDEQIEEPMNEEKLFTEEFQEKVRNEIFDTLNRQRMKQFKKEYRNLIFARFLLFLMFLLISLMSACLVYVVSKLYYRAKFLDASLSADQFISMLNDTAKRFK